MTIRVFRSGSIDGSGIQAEFVEIKDYFVESSIHHVTSSHTCTRQGLRVLHGLTHLVSEQTYQAVTDKQTQTQAV